MALLPTNPRDQKLAIAGIIGIVIFLAYWQLLWSDTDQTLTRLQTRVDSLDSMNVRAKAASAKGRSPAKMKAEADEFARQLTLLRKLVPTQNEVPALVDQVSTAARQAGLELSDVSPDAVVAGDNFDTYKYKIGVTGPYHEIAAFLTNIGSLQRIVVPINLSLVKSGRTGEKKAGPGEVLLDAKFGVETYVAHVEKPAAPASPGAKP